MDSKTELHIGTGHRKRLREKFLASGLDGFHDYEIIELLLTLGTPRRDCKQTAKDALKYFKSLQAVLDASPDELKMIKGIGPTNLFGIKLIKAVSEKYAKKIIIDRNPINNSNLLYQYLINILRDKKVECFLVIFLDSKNKIIELETLFEGTLNSANVYPREIIKHALRYNAAALIFAHNHPSGDPTPSSSDKLITRDLLFACRVMGLIAHEHIIIGDNTYYSFADNGYISEINKEFDNFYSIINV